MRTDSMTIWIAAAVLVLAANAETIYDQDGIKVQGTARIVEYNAGVCRVLEGHHSEEVYAMWKVNHNQPVHVWEIDFSAYNGSGGHLSHFRAYRNVDVAPPPCTNWSGPLNSWGPTVQLLETPSGLKPGEAVRDTKLLVVFHEHRPVIRDWDVEYTFANDVDTSQETIGGAEPPAAMTDPRGANKGSPQTRVPDGAGVPTTTDRVRASASQYTTRRELVGQHDQGMPLQNSERQTRIRRVPTCLGQPEGESCWMELANRPGCHVWNPHFSAGATVTWTSQCSSGVANGTGTLIWLSGQEERAETGLLQNGKQTGPWGVCFPNGTVQEGPFADGKRTGNWTLRLSNGDVMEGPIVDGKKHGRWVWRFANGTEGKGPYVHDVQTGEWVWQFANGAVHEGLYADGKRTGEWVERTGDGHVNRGPYLDGRRHGHWTWRSADGNVEEGPYASGARHGHWVWRSRDGSEYQGPYANGKRHGQWLLKTAGGSVSEGPYVEGERHGLWIERSEDGRVVMESSWENGRFVAFTWNRE